MKTPIFIPAFNRKTKNCDPCKGFEKKNKCYRKLKTAVFIKVINGKTNEELRREKLLKI